MDKVIVVDGFNGIKFNAVITDRKVTFYDTRFMHTAYGQHVSTYFMSTLVSGRDGLEKHGLALDFGVREWKVSPAGMKKFFDEVAK